MHTQGSEHLVECTIVTELDVIGKQECNPFPYSLHLFSFSPLCMWFVAGTQPLFTLVAFVKLFSSVHFQLHSAHSAPVHMIGNQQCKFEPLSTLVARSEVSI